MAMGAIELGTIARTQDYTTIKHNEDNKGALTQMTVSAQADKDNEQKARKVNNSEESQWQNKKFDAREKGSNSYDSDGGRNRKKKEQQEKMVVKGGSYQGFDMKI